MRVALFALVVVGLVALVRLAARRLPPAARSPFDPAPVPAVRPPVPFEVRRLSSDLELYQHPGGARLGSGAADRAVRGVVRDRLRRHHGIEAGEEPLADPAALAFLGPSTVACLARRASNDPAPIDPQALVDRAGGTCDRHRATRRSPSPTRRHAPRRILDEVERAVVGKRPVLELVLAGRARRRPRPARRPARRGQDADRPLAGHGDRAVVQPRPVHPRPAARRTSPARSCSTRGSGRFEFRPGPVFANLVLADEVNRAPAKTQSALLEAMQERQVSADGTSHGLPRPFLVVATQNPIEYEGTYPLPEAQLDRFLLRTTVGYPSPDDEWELVERRLERGTDDVELAAVVDRRRRRGDAALAGDASTSTRRSAVTSSPSSTPPAPTRAPGGGQPSRLAGAGEAGPGPGAAGRAATS